VTLDNIDHYSAGDKPAPSCMGQPYLGRVTVSEVSADIEAWYEFAEVELAAAATGELMVNSSTSVAVVLACIPLVAVALERIPKWASHLVNCRTVDTEVADYI